MRLWNASKQDVWWTGDNHCMSLHSSLLLMILFTFRLAFVSTRNYNNYDVQLVCWHVLCTVPCSNHFLIILSSCKQCGKVSWSCSWMLWMWLFNESYLARTVSLSPISVDETHQYRWFIILFVHSPISSNPFCFADFSSFLRNPMCFNNYRKLHYYNIPLATCQVSK